MHKVRVIFVFYLEWRPKQICHSALGKGSIPWNTISLVWSVKLKYKKKNKHIYWILMTTHTPAKAVGTCICVCLVELVSSEESRNEFVNLVSKYSSILYMVSKEQNRRRSTARVEWGMVLRCFYWHFYEAIWISHCSFVDSMVLKKRT